MTWRQRLQSGEYTTVQGDPSSLTSKYCPLLNETMPHVLQTPRHILPVNHFSLCLSHLSFPFLYILKSYPAVKTGSNATSPRSPPGLPNSVRSLKVQHLPYYAEATHLIVLCIYPNWTVSHPSLYLPLSPAEFSTHFEQATNIRCTELNPRGAEGVAKTCSLDR